MSDLTPPRRGEFLTKSGEPTHRFITWIESLTAASNSASETVSDQALQEQYPWPTSQLASETQSFIYPTLPSVTQSFNAVSVTNNYAALDYDFINAKNRAVITFPRCPDENSVIIVRNGDGSKITLGGNGRNINGSTTGALQREGTAITFQYFIDSNEWFAR